MPTPCANGCPFYGTPQTNNLCSACFRASGNAKCCPTPSSSSLAAVSSPTALAASSAVSSSPVPNPSAIEQPTSSSAIPAASSAPILSSTSAAPSAMSAEPQLPTPASPLPLDIAVQQQKQPEVKPVEEKQQQPPVVKTTTTKPKSIPKNRCAVCRKKLGLTPFNCRCGMSFCSLHRMPDVHNCEFDFKAHQRDILTRSNPAVIAKKVDKI